MRKFILAATGLICLSGVSYFLGTATGAGDAARDDSPHKIGLIDMAQIFDNYEKMKVLNNDFTAEAQTAEIKGKQLIENIQQKQKMLREFEQGSPEFAQQEKQLASQISELETYKKITELELARKRARMYQTIYLEVQDIVDAIAKRNGYTLVLRHERDDINTNDPQKVMAVLRRQVIFHRPSDDITEYTLKVLNSRYSKAANNAGGPNPGATPVNGAGKKPPVRPVGARAGE